MPKFGLKASFSTVTKLSWKLGISSTKSKLTPNITFSKVGHNSNMIDLNESKASFADSGSIPRSNSSVLNTGHLSHIHCEFLFAVHQDQNVVR